VHAVYLPELDDGRSPRGWWGAEDVRKRLPSLRFSAALIAALLLVPVATASGRAGGVLSTRLAELAAPPLSSASHAEQGRALSLASTGAGSLLRRGDGVVVEVRFDPGAMDATKLRAAGADVLDLSGTYRTATVAVVPQRLHALARVPGVEAVTEVLTPLVAAPEGPGSATSAYVQCAGAATTEGDTQLHAVEARQTYDVDGTGSTVGILSDSFNTDESASTNAADDVASGDLPGPGNPCGRTSPVSVLEDLNYNGDADEGRGMAQIVHDLAPGAKLAFATAFTSEAGFAQNIERLAKPVAQGGGGADVIADDVVYFNEPMFQEGPIAVAAGNVTAGGASYYSAAGNDNLIDGSGRDIASWEAPSFRDASSCPSALGASSAKESCMDFNSGSGSDSTFGITVSPGWTLTVDLQWAEPWNGVSTDLDASLLDSSGKRIKEKGLYVGGFEDNPGTSKKPLEIIQWTNSAGSAREVQLAIVRCFAECNPGAASGTAPRLKFALLQNGGGVTATEYPQSSGGDVVGPTIFGHAGAQSVVGTGAIEYNSTTQPEKYSSRGPVTHYFGPVEGSGAAPPLGSPQTLGKPNVTATDGGATTFFGSLISGTWRFYGTSAAAPHAAAVAALIRDADPLATPTQIRAALEGTADPIGTYGSNAVGAGLVNAKDAVAEFAEEPPPDETPPDTTITSGPDGLTNDSTPTFHFSSTEAGSSFECRIDAGTFAPCTSPYTAATLADGPHTFYVQATDEAGNTDPTPASRSFTVDTQAPDTSITSGPAGPTDDSTPTFGFSSPDPEASFECHFDSQAFAACSGAGTHTPSLPLADGPHTFYVRATDKAGNTDPTPASRSFTIDTQAPDTSITSGPEGPTNDTEPSFDFTSTEAGSSFECRIDLGSFASCTSPYTAATLADGAHTFYVRAKDEAGNTDLTPASRSFTVDTLPPAAPSGLTTVPASPANDNAPLVSGQAETGSTVKVYRAPTSSDCVPANVAASGGAASFASTGLSVSVADNSTTTFRANATDAAGNASGCSISSIVYSEDSQPPDTTITSGPEGVTDDSTPTFGFSSPDPQASFECRFDSQAFAACSGASTHTPSKPLLDGIHTFEVRAIDQAGNTDPTPASRTFTVNTTVPDETPPETSITSGPEGPTNNPSPTFGFSSTEEPAAFECRIDLGSFASCTSPYTAATPADGSHTFYVRAKDEAGNTDLTPASRTFTVDTVAPQTQIDSGPLALDQSTEAEFAFSGLDPGGSGVAAFQCRLDSGEEADWEDCVSAKTYTGLVDGLHVFEVRAIDQAGNTDESPVKREFTVNAAVLHESTPSLSVIALPVPEVFPSDNVPPEVEFSVPRRQRVGKPIKVEVSCDEDCRVVAQGSVVLRRPAHRRPSAHLARLRRRLFGLRQSATRLNAGQTAILRVRPKSRRAAGRLNRLVHSGWLAVATISIKCVDLAGNTTTRRVRIGLRPRRRS
jgi:Subtilase family/Bacterial Ig-like domain